MPNTHQNIQSLGAGGMYGTNTVYGGGGVPVARSELDFLRIGVGRQPSAEYPDGYLGTIRTRREDRGRTGDTTSDNVLRGVKGRVNQRAYQRGVHRGERIDQSDYYYPEGLEADRGIKRQMQASYNGSVYLAKRNAENQKLVPNPHLQNDGKSNLRSTSIGEINQVRAHQLKSLVPSWR